MSDVKKETANSMLELIERDIIKFELEIEIHSKIEEKLIDDNDILENQRKIDTFNKNLTYLKNKKEALLKILGI